MRFCEVAVLKCPRLKQICLKTKRDNTQNQDETLKQIAASLKAKNVTLNICYVEHLHDRMIKLSTGLEFVIKIYCYN